MFLAPILMLAGGVFWLLLLVGLVLLAVGAFRAWSGSGAWQRAAPPPSDDPLAILAARYARGEISREDYLQARQDISGGGVR